MSRRGLVLAALAGSLALGVLAVPALMFLVVVGVDGTVDEVCAPAAPDVVLAAEGGGLSGQQLANAAAVVAVGNEMDVPRRGFVVALAVASQESRFLNYANDGRGSDLAHSQQGIEASLALPHEAVGTDHGSLGMFQQQWPWWGTMPELMDPATAARKFYEALLEVPGWEALPVTVAGQAVQRSAYPDAYADDEALAERLLSGAAITPAAYSRDCVPTGAGTAVFPLPPGSGYADRGNFGASGAHWARGHTGTDLSVACGTPVLAATDGTVVVETDQAWSGPWLVKVTTGAGRLTTWYAHMQELTVADGDVVHAGQQLGRVGSEGNSTGCHLHFEVHPRGGSIYADGVDPTAWLARNVGRDLDPPAVPAALRGSVSLVTANVPFPLPPRAAAAQVGWLLAQRPDVLVLQEVHDRDLPAVAARAPGSWRVWHPPRRQRGSAIVWNADRLTLVRRGAALGFDGAAYDRWLTWAVLRGDSGTFAVVALHLPTGAYRSPVMRQHYVTMTERYRALVGRLRAAGHPVVMGADWNRPLDVAVEPWSPVPALRGIGMTTNWQHGTPCPRTSIHGGRIDGFAYDPSVLRLEGQGCLPRRHSDHRPVWVRLGPR